MTPQDNTRQNSTGHYMAEHNSTVYNKTFIK